jgi:hypothetical protein
MKLLHCFKCRDTVALIQEWRFCACGESLAKYESAEEMSIDRRAVYSGPSVILGVPNEQLAGIHEYTGTLTPPECVGKWVVISRTASTLVLLGARERRLLTAGSGVA